MRNRGRQQPASGAVASGGQVTVTLGVTQIAIVLGPYRFAGRGGTARVGIKCISSDAGVCKGRLELERWKGGQGKGIALAVGDFDIETGNRKRITLRLNARARKRITTKGAIAVRALRTTTDAAGPARADNSHGTTSSTACSSQFTPGFAATAARCCGHLLCSPSPASR